MSATTPAKPHIVNPADLSIHAAPIGPIEFHVKRIDQWRLVNVGPNGQQYPIRLTKEQQNRFDALCGQLNTKNAANFSLNIQELLGTADGDEIEYSSEDPAIAELRELVHTAAARDIAWKSFPKGHRASVTEHASFQASSGRLKVLRFSDDDFAASLSGNPAPTKQEKLARLKRHEATKRLLQSSRNLLQTLETAVPPKTLETPARKERLRQTGVLLTPSLEATLCFEATHPLALAAMPEADQVKAVQAKQEKAKAWIEGHAVPKQEKGTFNKFFSQDVDATEETHFAEDMARLGCKSRGDYRALDASGRREGPELFYARLAEAVATGDNAQIDAVIDGPLFSLVFSKVHVHDQELCREQLRAEAQNISQRLGNVNPDAIHEGSSISNFNTEMARVFS